MKELFPEFYLDSLQASDLGRDQRNLIVFDTNFLLDILRLPTDIAEKYLEAIDKVKEHIFVPFLVGVEFNFNKKQVKIETQEHLNVYRDSTTKIVNDKVTNMYNEMFNSLVETKVVGFLKNKNQKDNALKKIEESINSYFELVSNEKDKLIERLQKNIFERYSTNLDELSNRIVELIGHSVAPKLEKDFIEELQKEGKDRYDNKIPPGYNDRDAKADEIRRYSDLVYYTQYGDYIIWKEILNKVSEEGENIGKKVIFVTSDGTSNKKNDIMYIVKGRKVGPYIQMVNELYELKGKDSLDENNESGQQLNKELYVIDGFRFMQLANDLNDDEAKRYEVDSQMPILDLSKDFDKFKNQKRLIYELSHQIRLLKRKYERLEANIDLAKSEEEKELLSYESQETRIKLYELERQRRLLNQRIKYERYDGVSIESEQLMSKRIDGLRMEYDYYTNEINELQWMIDGEIIPERILELEKRKEILESERLTLSAKIVQYESSLEDI